MRPHEYINVLNTKITPEAIEEAANILDVEPVELKVILEVETNGKAFDSKGRLIRRFEPHHFPEKHWGEIGFHPKQLPPWRASLKLSRKAREAMFEAAVKIDLEEAYKACSWGAPQIMGFNHEDAGYPSAIEMVEAFSRSADEQILALARLLVSWGLDSCIRSHNWLEFAAVYNGSGQVDKYAARLESAWRWLTGQPSRVVLRRGSKGDSVVILQERLKELGYEITAVDGYFGAETERAVTAFQKDVGLKVDGVVGARTWEALDTEEEPDIQESDFERKVIKAIKTSGPAVVGGVGGRWLENLNDTAETILISGLVLCVLGVMAWFLLPRIRRVL